MIHDLTPVQQIFSVCLLNPCRSSGKSEDYIPPPEEFSSEVQFWARAKEQQQVPRECKDQRRSLFIPQNMWQLRMQDVEEDFNYLNSAQI